MKKFVKPTSLIFIICLIILAGFGLYGYFFQSQMVKSASNDNVSGYAWSSNIGWISFGGDNYGVSVDEDGKLSGHAWSENIGWISFECDGCTAKIDKPKKLGKQDVAVLGLARALAYGGGWDGWIKFDHGKNDEVYIDEGGEFRGRAWGSDVIGWITFNFVDDSSSYSFTCGTEGGDTCQNNEFCPISGKILNVGSSCCSVGCVLKLCEEQGGDICQGAEVCTGVIISARNTGRCCSGACAIPPPPPLGAP